MCLFFLIYLKRNWVCRFKNYFTDIFRGFVVGKLMAMSKVFNCIEDVKMCNINVVP